VDDLSQEERGAEYCEDEAEWSPCGEKDGAFHLHTPSLQIVGDSHYYKPLTVVDMYVGVHQQNFQMVIKS